MQRVEDDRRIHVQLARDRSHQALLGRYRFASQAERAWIRDTLRAHVAEHFPELEAP